MKLRGAFHQLRPPPNAADMFPFTYDHWTDDGMTVRIVADGTPKRKGRKALSATLEILIGERSSMHAGHLDCGT